MFCIDPPPRTPKDDKDKAMKLINFFETSLEKFSLKVKNTYPVYSLLYSVRDTTICIIKEA